MESGSRAKREAHYPKANKTLITASAEEEGIMEGEDSHCQLGTAQRRCSEQRPASGPDIATLAMTLYL